MKTSDISYLSETQKNNFQFLNIYVTIQVDDSDVSDFEPPPPDLNVNEDALFRAMRQSLSLWKSHGDTLTGRRKTRRTRRRHYSSDSRSEEEDIDDWEEENDVESDEDDNYEPPIHTKVTTWSGNY